MEMLINEVLNTEFTVHDSPESVHYANSALHNQIHPEYTQAWQSDHMKSKGLSVVKVMKPKNTIEYHLHDKYNPGNINMDKTSSLHVLRIIHDDANKELANPDKRTIQLQSGNAELDKMGFGREAAYKSYLKLGQRLSKQHKGVEAIDAGYRPGAYNQQVRTVIIRHKNTGSQNPFDGVKAATKPAID